MKDAMKDAMKVLLTYKRNIIGYRILPQTGTSLGQEGYMEPILERCPIKGVLRVLNEITANKGRKLK